MPKKGNITGTDLLLLQGLVCLLKDSVALVGHAQKVIEGYGPAFVLDALLAGPDVIHEPDGLAGQMDDIMPYSTRVNERLVVKVARSAATRAPRGVRSHPSGCAQSSGARLSPPSRKMTVMICDGSWCCSTGLMATRNTA